MTNLEFLRSTSLIVGDKKLEKFFEKELQWEKEMFPVSSDLLSVEKIIEKLGGDEKMCGKNKVTSTEDLINFLNSEIPWSKGATWEIPWIIMLINRKLFILQNFEFHSVLPEILNSFSENLNTVVDYGIFFDWIYRELKTI